MTKPDQFTVRPCFSSISLILVHFCGIQLILSQGDGEIIIFRSDIRQGRIIIVRLAFRLEEAHQLCGVEEADEVMPAVDDFYFFHYLAYQTTAS